MNSRSLQFVMDEHRNRNFWVEESPGRWQFNGWSTRQDGENEVQTLRGEAHFQASDYLEYNAGPGYITIGKGYP